jgi:hypothetical protein
VFFFFQHFPDVAAAYERGGLLGEKVRALGLRVEALRATMMESGPRR